MTSLKENINSVGNKDRYTFWLNDVTVLFRNKGYVKFIPTYEMTRVEQLNAMTLFCMYLIIILFIFNKTDDLLCVPIIAIILFIVLYNVFEVDNKGKQLEIMRIKKQITNDIDSVNEYESNNIGDDMEVGYYDSNNKIVYNNTNNKIKDINYSLDDIREYSKNSCIRPTENNPFMNPSTNDFNNPEKIDGIVACNTDDDEIIDKDIDDKFNADLYRDIDDVYNKKNSQRQFFTIPQSVPNDQEAFGRWCYKFPATCKTDQTRCTRYQDYRVKY